MDDDLLAAWPLAGLELRLGDLVLRPTTDADAVVHGRIAHGLLTPATAHFMPGLTVAGETVGAAQRRNLQRLWGLRSSLRPDDWNVSLAVVDAGTVVGEYSVYARHFARQHEVATGVLVDPAHQGRGVAAAAGAMVLELVFVHLGGLSAEHSFAEGNVASRRLAHRLGYRPASVSYKVVDGRRVASHRWTLPAARWPDVRPTCLDALEVRGLDAVRPLLGA